MADKLTVAALVERAQRYIRPHVVVETSLSSWANACELIGQMADKLGDQRSELIEATRSFVKIKIALDQAVLDVQMAKHDADSRPKQSGADTDLRITAMELATKSPSCGRGAPEAAVAADILKFLRNCDAPAAAPTPATQSDNGLDIQVKDDGVWLYFTANDGQQAGFSIGELAEKYKIDGGRAYGVIATALLQWAYDRLTQSGRRS